jgi:hypothetical protein
MKKKMKMKKLFAALALSSCALDASAWMVTFSGTIDYGFDNTGVFGTANQNLAGLSFTQSITAITDPAQWTLSSGNAFFQEVSGFGPAFTNTVTVNGHSVMFDIDATSYGRQTLFDQLSTQGGGQDLLWTEQRGLDANGDVIWGQQYAFSNTQPFVPTLDFNQTIDHSGAGLTSYAHFTITGERNAHFYSYNNSFVINDKPVVNPPVEVPEPPLISLFMAALGLAGLVRLRKTRQAD